MSRLLSEWTSAEISELVAFRQNESRREKRAAKQPQPKQQSDKDMLAVLDKL